MRSWTEDGESTDLNTVVFRLKVKCTKNPHAPPNAVKEEDKYINSRVTSGQLEWVPQGNQLEMFKECPIEPVHKDIVIAKLRPGQEIEVQLHCEKGIGRMHAKWSPVGITIAPSVSMIFNNAFCSHRVLPSPAQGQDPPRD